MDNYSRCTIKDEMNPYSFNQADIQEHSACYSVRVKNEDQKDLSQTRIRISKRIVKIILLSGIAFVIYCIFNVALGRSCIDLYKQYDCGQTGKHSKICGNILNCINDQDSNQSCRSEYGQLLSGIITLIIAYFTIEHRNPLIAFWTLKQERQRQRID